MAVHTSICVGIQLSTELYNSLTSTPSHVEGGLFGALFHTTLEWVAEPKLFIQEKPGVAGIHIPNVESGERNGLDLFLNM